MKKSSPFLLFALLFALASCDGTSGERVSFDSAFPKPNKDLTSILGKTVKLKNGSDTIELAISSGKETNLIANAQTGDTLFYGKVSKFRGLYYFSQAVNDTSYLIHAVKISDNLIFGLASVFQQTALIDEAVTKGSIPKLVKYISPDSTIFRLHPEKREFRKLYSRIISTIKPDTLLHQPKKDAALKAIVASEQTDAEELELIYKVYPNPMLDFVNVELQQKNVAYQLIDSNGKTLVKGKLNEPLNRINTTKLKSGIYILTLVDTEGMYKESTRLMKN